MPQLLRYLFLASAWAWFAAETFAFTSRPTSVICPDGKRLESLTPTFQVMTLFLDAFILTSVAKLKHDHDESSSRRPTLVLAVASILSAVMLGLVSFSSFYRLANIEWAFILRGIAFRDLVLDSILLSAAFLSGIHLLATLNSWTIATTFAGISLYIELWKANWTPGARWDVDSRAWTLGTLALICLILLLRYDRDAGQSRLSNDSVVYKALSYSVPALSCLLLASHVIFGPRIGGQTTGDHTIARLATYAADNFNSWQLQAKRSTNLQEAVEEYRRRHGYPPPPNFDKWYTFAVERNSTIIDDFADIDKDLRPFWGVSPARVRDLTAHLLEHPRLSIGGLRIRNGEIKISPHVPGTHMWMMEGYTNMMKPFLQWLPDMDLAFNLDDECRMAIPWEERMSLEHVAASSVARLNAVAPKDLSSWSVTPDKTPKKAPLWSDKFLEKDNPQAPDPHAESPFFTDRIRRQVYYSHISPSCPPQSPARNFRWWNRKTSCSICAEPHTFSGLHGSFVTNWTLAGDLCHQPDMAYLHGLILSAAPMVVTTNLFPVFSQGRVGGFGDILVPSPWNYNEKVTFDDNFATPWPQKHNAVFWRGGPSDGFAAHGAWVGFLRARFVRAAAKFMRNQQSNAGRRQWSISRPSISSNRQPPIEDVGVNVTYVGNFHKCDGPDCAAEEDTFYPIMKMTRPPDPPPGKDAPPPEPPKEDHEHERPPEVPFAENWRYRHLVDLDGAGFSGRFIPFMQSYSLVYRAGLFRTWYDSRIHPWLHFVPLDARLVDRGLWSIFRFFASARGDGLAQRIAVDGREWTNKALRKEDMEIYFFRLLLEWGRVVDDKRETLGFDTAA
jgi:hypothetical protein